MSRDIENIHCSCSGVYEYVDTKTPEIKKYGCHRDTKTNNCCVAAMECNKCKTRLTISFCAPDYD